MRNIFRNSLLLLSSLFLLSGCDFPSSTTTDPSSSSSFNTSKKLDVNVTSSNVSYNEYLGYSIEIYGTAKNISNKNYSYASVEFSIYSESGSIIGTALDNINNLGKGETWEFKATSFALDFKPISYKLKDTTCF